MDHRDVGHLEPRYEFWYLLGLIEETIGTALRDGQVDRALVRTRMAQLQEDEHAAIVESLEVAVIGLDFTERILESIRRGARPWRKRRDREAEDLPSTEAGVRERLESITDGVMRSGEGTRYQSSIVLPELTERAEAVAAVRKTLGVMETAVGLLGMRSSEVRAAATARLGSLSANESQRLLWAVRTVEAAIALVLLEFDGLSND